MNVRNKQFSKMTKADQDKMIAAITKQYYQDLFEDEANMQIKWIKMMCIGLYRSGHTQDEILIAIGQWRSLYRQNSRFNSDKEQEEWLAEELAKVFPDGFPEQVVQDFKKL